MDLNSVETAFADVHRNVLIQNTITVERGGADVPLFETIKTNAGTQPKNELQQ